MLARNLDEEKMCRQLEVSVGPAGSGIFENQNTAVAERDFCRLLGGAFSS
jgi:hypothetical protein